jgi:hypothetical protein
MNNPLTIDELWEEINSKYERLQHEYNAQGTSTGTLGTPSGNNYNRSREGGDKALYAGSRVKGACQKCRWLDIRRQIVDQTETSLKGNKVPRRHLERKVQHPPQVPQSRLKVQEEVPVLDSRVHVTTVSGLVTEKHNVSTSLEISETLQMQQLPAAFQTQIQWMLHHPPDTGQQSSYIIVDTYKW